MKNKPESPRDLGGRVIVLNSIDEDGATLCSVLEEAGFHCKACSTPEELRRKLEEGAGTAVIAEETFVASDPASLLDWVQHQPAWSDFPFIVLTSREAKSSVKQKALALLNFLQNVTFQERPVQTTTLVSAVSSAL